MKDEKGFTLIELIAVIIIIGLVALIAIPFFTGSFEDFKKNFYTNLNTTFLSGGKEFFSDNSKYLPRRYLYAQKVSLDTLQNENYLKSFKDYTGADCDLERSYVIVIKLANKKYDYAACLVCPNDNYESLNSKYCKDEWGPENLNIDYVLGEIKTQYVYKGTSREVVKEKTKVTLDVVKYNGAGEEVARVSGVGEDGIGVIYPSNLDIIDTNRVGEYETVYTYQGLTKKGKVIVYENGTPVVVANRKQNVKDKTKNIEAGTTVEDTREYDNSSRAATPNDIWAQKLVYSMSSSAITEPGVTISEFQWYINNRWEMFCKPTGGSNSCTKTVDEEMNETVKFRSIDTKGHIGVISRDYVVRIDRTNPQCKLSIVDPDGTNGWHVADFDIKFGSKIDTAKTANGKNVTSGLVENYSTVAINGTKLNATGVLGDKEALQTADSKSFVWYGYVEDKAGNWNRCYNQEPSGPSPKTPGANEILKKDKTPPTCTLKLSSGTAEGNYYTSANIKIAFNTKTDATSDMNSYGIGLATPSYNNKTEYTYSGSGTNDTVMGVVKDNAGNTNNCTLQACSRQQKKTRNAATCKSSCCGTYTCYGNWGAYSWTGTCHTSKPSSSNTTQYSCNGPTNRGICEFQAGLGYLCKKRTRTSKTCNKTCTSSSCCGYTSWSSWSEDSSCTSPTGNNCTGKKCCRKVYKIGNNCGAASNKTFTASFEGNGGTYKGTCATEGTCSIPDKSCTTTGSSCNITLPANAYARTNKTFKGWNTNANATTGTAANTSVTLSSDVTYYAIWENQTQEFTASFNANKGTGTTNPVKCTATKPEFDVTMCEVTLPSSGFTRRGYTFDGWLETATSTDQFYDGANYYLTANKTFYAKWNINTYTITYDLKGGSVSGSNPATYTVETNDITLINPTRAHYIFKGWTGTDLSSATMTVKIPKGSIGNRSYTATWEAAPQAAITCTNPTWTGNNLNIATCSGGTIQNMTHKDAGSYTVTCAADFNHSDSSKSCSIAKANSVITCTNPTYTGNNLNIATCVGGTLSGHSQTNAGNHTVTCTGDSNHNTTTKSCGIAKANSVITCTNPTYTGNNLNIATCVGGTLSGHSQTNAGNHTVTCTGDSNHNTTTKSCGIAKANSVITCTNPTYTGNNLNIATCVGGTLSGHSQTNAGNHTVTCTGDSNHNTTTKSCGIAKANSVITCTNPTYTGNNLNIATCVGGTLSGHTRTNVDTYTVTCTGDSNHNTTTAICGMRKANAVLTCTNPTWNGYDQYIATCSGGTPNGHVQRNIGSYTVSCTGDSNHNSTANATCYMTCPSGLVNNGAGGCMPPTVVTTATVENIYNTAENNVYITNLNYNIQPTCEVIAGGGTIVECRPNPGYVYVKVSGITNTTTPYGSNDGCRNYYYKYSPSRVLLHNTATYDNTSYNIVDAGNEFVYQGGKCYVVSGHTPNHVKDDWSLGSLPGSPLNNMNYPWCTSECRGNSHCSSSTNVSDRNGGDKSHCPGRDAKEYEPCYTGSGTNGPYCRSDTEVCYTGGKAKFSDTHAAGICWGSWDMQNIYQATVRITYYPN